MRKVGRPKKTDRDAAIFLARWWRVNCLHESVSEADAWILQHWRDNTPSGKSVGITDVAHVRAAVRRCDETWLKDAVITVTDGIGVKDGRPIALDPGRATWNIPDSVPDGFAWDACLVSAVEFVLHGRSRLMFWAPGMKEIHRGHTVLVDEGEIGPSWADRQGRTCIATAVGQYVGLLRQGRLERFRMSDVRPWDFGGVKS